MKEAERIRLILSDIDGVMTDGKIIHDSRGNEIKEFSARDGFGIRLWMKNGGLFGIVTGRESKVVEIRAGELGVELLEQGIVDKAETVRRITSRLGVPLEETAFIGDDYPDLPALKIVGFPAAVADAADEIRDAAAWVSDVPGGKGAVRQLIETILKAQGRWDGAIRFYRGGSKVF